MVPHRIFHWVETIWGWYWIICHKIWLSNLPLPHTLLLFEVAGRNACCFTHVCEHLHLAYTESSQHNFDFAEVLLWHRGSPVSNQSIVSLEEIRGGSDLFCLTNSDTRCSRVGSWYFPDGSEVPESGDGLRRIRGRSYAALTYTMSPTPPPSGLYRCVIPDSNGQNVILFAGIYRSNSNLSN